VFHVTNSYVCGKGNQMLDEESWQGNVNIVHMKYTETITLEELFQVEQWGEDDEGDARRCSGSAAQSGPGLCPFGMAILLLVDIGSSHGAPHLSSMTDCKACVGPARVVHRC